MRLGAHCCALLGSALLFPLLLCADAAATARPQPGRSVAKARPGKAAVRGGKKDLRHGKAQRRGRKKRREVPPQMPSRIELTAIDLVSGTAHLDVIGTTRPPVTQLFVLLDQTGRRYAPSFAECHPPPGVQLAEVAAASGAEPGEGEDSDEGGPAPGTPELPATTRWRCSLSIPRLYRHAPITGITMEWGRLSVAASEQTVQRLWGEARALAPLTALAERPPAPLAGPTAGSTTSQASTPRRPTSGPGSADSAAADPPLDDDPGEPGDSPQDPPPGPRSLHAAE